MWRGDAPLATPASDISPSDNDRDFICWPMLMMLRCCTAAALVEHDVRNAQGAGSKQPYFPPPPTTLDSDCSQEHYQIVKLWLQVHTAKTHCGSVPL